MEAKQVQEVTANEWLEQFEREWHQGEHVVILGPTGSGKTFFVHQLLDTRSHVAVLAVKPRDDTLERFKQGERYGRSKYKVIKKWPPDYGYKKVVYWEKPKGLDKLREQAIAIHSALDRMYREGGWTIYVDEAGYVAGTLGLGRALGVLLNQGRSSKISMVITVTRPTSVIARVPKEAFSQPRHKLIFKYENADEMKAASQVADVSLKELEALQAKLNTYHPKGYTDFIYVGKGKIQIVRNQGAT